MSDKVPFYYVLCKLAPGTRQLMEMKENNNNDPDHNAMTSLHNLPPIPRLF